MARKDDIIDEAMRQGKARGWERVTLVNIAVALNITLADIYQYFSQKDDIVDAWFNRADQTLLEEAPHPAWDSLDTAGRLESALWTWLASMSEYRTVTRQMLYYKLEPGHIHLQAAAVLRISRTVQWFREAASLKAVGLQRIGQELALTQLFVCTFLQWLNDSSDQQQRTRLRLRNKLASGQRFNLWK